MKKYTKSHEWIEATEGIATVGISEHAQEQLGDIVYVDLPGEGEK
jgi:glycine cleavage system H protein